VLVTGMTIGTFFTLFVVPSIYMLIARNHSADRRTAQETTANSELEHAAGVASIRGDVLLAAPRESIVTRGTSNDE
jgi:hypothetical protein